MIGNQWCARINKELSECVSSFCNTSALTEWQHIWMFLHTLFHLRLRFVEWVSLFKIIGFESKNNYQWDKTKKELCSRSKVIYLQFKSILKWIFKTFGISFIFLINEIICAMGWKSFKNVLSNMVLISDYIMLQIIVHYAMDYTISLMYSV